MLLLLRMVAVLAKLVTMTSAARIIAQLHGTNKTAKMAGVFDTSDPQRYRHHNSCLTVHLQATPGELRTFTEGTSWNICRTRCLELAEELCPQSMCAKVSCSPSSRQLEMYISRRFVAGDGGAAQTLLRVAKELKDAKIGVVMRAGFAQQECLIRGAGQLETWYAYDAEGVCLMVCVRTEDAKEEKELVKGLHDLGLAVLSSSIAGERGGVGDLYIQICPYHRLPSRGQWPSVSMMGRMHAATRLAASFIEAEMLKRLVVHQVRVGTSVGGKELREFIDKDEVTLNGAILSSVEAVLPLATPVDLIHEAIKRASNSTGDILRALADEEYTKRGLDPATAKLAVGKARTQTPEEAKMVRTVRVPPALVLPCGAAMMMAQMHAAKAALVKVQREAETAAKATAAKASAAVRALLDRFKGQTTKTDKEIAQLKKTVAELEQQVVGLKAEKAATEKAAAAAVVAARRPGTQL